MTVSYVEMPNTRVLNFLRDTGTKITSAALLRLDSSSVMVAKFVQAQRSCPHGCMSVHNFNNVIVSGSRGHPEC